MKEIEAVWQLPVYRCNRFENAVPGSTRDHMACWRPKTRSRGNWTFGFACRPRRDTCKGAHPATVMLARHARIKARPRTTLCGARIMGGQDELRRMRSDRSTADRNFISRRPTDRDTYFRCLNIFLVSSGLLRFLLLSVRKINATSKRIGRSAGKCFITISGPTRLPRQHSPELGLDVGVRLQGHFHRGVIASTSEQLHLNPCLQGVRCFQAELHPLRSTSLQLNPPVRVQSQ